MVEQDNWVIFKGEDNQEVFPVWPEHDLATVLCFKEHHGLRAKPQVVEIQAFLNKCIPDMDNQGIMFGVFYNKNRQGLCVNLGKLYSDLNSEFEEVWG